MGEDGETENKKVRKRFSLFGGNKISTAEGEYRTSFCKAIYPPQKPALCALMVHSAGFLSAARFTGHAGFRADGSEPQIHINRN